MSTSYIRTRSSQPHRAAGLAVIKAIRDTDETIRALQRRQDLFPAEQDRRIAEAREAGTAEVAKHRAALAAAVAKDRAESRYSEPPPTVEQAAQRSYYAAQATAELSGITNPTEVLATVKAVAAEGNDERSREYLRAAAGRAPSGALAGVGRRVEPPEARMHRSFAAAVDSMDYYLGWFDQWTSEHLARVGQISEEAKAGLAPEEPMSTRQLALWVDALDQRAAEAFEANEQREAAQAGMAEALAEHLGPGGYDAASDPNPHSGTGADSQDDQSDAGDTP